MQKFTPIIVGIIFLAAGVFMYVKHENLVRNCTVETKASVVDIKEELNAESEGSTYIYYPVIKYNVGEETNQVTMDSGSNSPEYSIGDEITILYNPNNTKEFIVKGDNASWILGIVFSILGAVISVYGVYVLIRKN